MVKVTLDKICEGVCDGSVSGAKSFKEIVQADPKHATAGSQKDIWHKTVTIKKKYNLLTQKKGQEELKSKLPARKFERWFSSCAHDCGGDAVVFQSNWLGAADHYRGTLQLSDHAYFELYQFLHGFASDIEYYVRCRSTARVESLHNLSIKYASK